MGGLVRVSAAVAIAAGSAVSVVPAGAASAASVAVGDVTVTEPNKNGSVVVEVPIVLDQPVAEPIAILWSVAAGSAGSADVVLTSGTVTIAAGASSAAVPVTVKGDRTGEGTEVAHIDIASADAAVVDGRGALAIRNAASGLSVGDVTVLEADAGTARVGVPLVLADPPKKPVAVGYQVQAAGTSPVSATVTIPAGQRVAHVAVGVPGDTTDEPDQSLSVVVTSVSNASLADGTGTVTVVDDDEPPAPPPPPPPGDFGWSPPASSVPATPTALYLESTPGDWIGQGRTYAYSLATSEIVVTTSGSRITLSVDGDESWSATFQGTTATTVETGLYEGLQRYPFFVPGLSFSGEGRGCNTLAGRLRIDQVEYGGDSVVDQLMLRFEQRCDGDPPLYGFLRYDADDPTTPPPPGDAADFPWSPPVEAVPEGTHLYFESSAGDYIGQGRTELHVPATDAITVTESSGVVTMRVTWGDTSNWWDLRLSGPDAQVQLAPGLYADLQRYPFHNPVEGGLSFSGQGRGCNELAGAFAIDEVTYDSAGLASVSGRFVQRCEVVDPPLYGSFRWSRP